MQQFEPSKMNALKIAVSCSSNMNRSMEAHYMLAKKGYNVRSFGTGDKVKLPGQSIDKPNVYDFNTTYDEIYNDLASKNRHFYTQNGLLLMLERNRRIKSKPEKFQLCEEKFDVIITCEERVFDQVLEHVNSVKSEKPSPVHIININIVDNPEEATIGALYICELAVILSKCRDLDNDLCIILPEYEERTGRTYLHSMMFY